MTIRLRLTVLFFALFTVLAAGLVATSYIFVANATTREAQAQERFNALQDALAADGVAIPDGLGTGPLAGVGTGDRPSPGPQDDPDAVGGASGIFEFLRKVDEQARQNVLRDLLEKSLLAFAAITLVTVPLAYWLAGRVLRPVDRIVAAANAASEDTLDRRLDHRGPDDEFGRLTRSFNGMLARLQTAFDARQRFAADASHELRTPLAVLEARADNTLATPRVPRAAKDLASDVKEQVHRADSLIGSLLTLARADDVKHTREPVDLADLAADAVADLEGAATERGIAIEADLADSPVTGDAVLLGRMVWNLLNNAIRYNLPTGGTVECAAGTVDGASQIRITNTGERVDPGTVDALFERFIRGGTREDGGYGLGLAIVRRVADVHGAQLRARPGTHGGLDITVRFPAGDA